MSETQVIKLSKPFKWVEDEPEITEIEIREPTVGDIRGLNFDKLKYDADEILKLAQKLIGKPPAFLNKISLNDFQKIVGALEHFLPSDQKGES